ncbi:YckD family protein [Halalkalibacter akibai]|uniref:DUF2680 domain-containing protein n=1 Tax=Halalkalibacter akibai (strain ATCC 43226 / DSM 21942 / CIP 109018 / JCM 9157 / 1139) TaxID=1236973 RepID=W4QQY1_HALA3|nr:YckD family protein [Halalkalibacter akibai]GAE33759.1 hypothetical protein JCM9157_783 [Halalkalibacter akibai JCM 9157]
MKKFSLMIILVTAFMCLPTFILAEETEIKLTDEQRQEMAQLHMEVMKKKKEIITKYVDYGVFTPEKADKINAMIDKHFEKLEENNFIPKWDDQKKHKH